MVLGKIFITVSAINFGSVWGKKSQPTLGIIDSQTVKSTQYCDKDTRGYDGGKKSTGRKRHILVDTLGLIHGLLVHAANISEKAGAKLLLEKIKDKLLLLVKILADGGYSGQEMIDWVKEHCHGWVWEVVKRTELHLFKVLPKRWIVERTFSWFNHYRRLSKDYELTCSTSENMIYISMTHLMLKRLAGLQTVNLVT